MTLFINPDRLQSDFDALSAIGAFEDAEGNRGVNRPALSPAHLEARAWFLARAADRESTISKHTQVLVVGSLGGRTVEVSPTDTMRLPR